MLNDMYIDHRTGLNNYMRFMTEDIHRLFGDSGQYVIIKVKPLKVINEKYGRSVGDELIAMQGKIFLGFSCDYPVYHFEANGVIVVFKDKNQESIDTLIEAATQQFSNEKKKLNADEARLFTCVCTYNEPIHSLADFYYNLFHNYKIHFNRHSDDKEIIHHILFTITDRVRDSIDEYSTMRSFALHDDVSNLPNSKSAKIFLDAVEHTQSSFSIIFIDGDNLSRFNQISYDEGNHAIRCIGKTISDSIRKMDRVFRWLSGDEYLVFTDITDREELNLFAERIRYNTEQLGQTMKHHTTISLGISSYPADADTVEHVIRNAELANKEAKRQGKNRVVYYSDDLLT